jgi:hypothetical protein
MAFHLSQGEQLLRYGKLATSSLEKVYGVVAARHRKLVKVSAIEGMIGTSKVMTGIHACSPVKYVPLPKPKRISATVRHQGQRVALSIIPDYRFLLYPDGKQVEYTMEYTRSGQEIYWNDIVNQTSVYQKLLVYLEDWQPGKQTLVVTITPARVERMIEKLAPKLNYHRGDYKVNRNAILFGSESIADNPFEKPWMNIRGESVYLL